MKLAEVKKVLVSRRSRRLKKVDRLQLEFIQMDIVDQIREARIEKAIEKSEVAKQIEVVEETRLKKAEKKSKDAKEMEVAEEVEDDTMEIVDREKEVAEATSKILTKPEEPDKKKLPTNRKRRTKLEI